MPLADFLPAFGRSSRRTFRCKRLLKRAAGGYLLAEGAYWAHYNDTKRRARAANPPARRPVDVEYGERFLSLARCDSRDGSYDPIACARFVRHAFFGVPPEALSRDAVHDWLRHHLGESATDESLAALEEALGPCAFAHGDAPKGLTSATGSSQKGFVFGEGQLEALYKPLPLRLYLEAKVFAARRRLAEEGFVEHRCPTLPMLRFWERRRPPPLGRQEENTLVVLHGYGRGLASPLFEGFVPSLGRSSIIIVECSWLLVTSFSTDGDITRTPTVHEIAEGVAAFLRERLTSTSTSSSSQPASVQVDLLGHSFGTAVTSALARMLSDEGGSIVVRRAVLMDPMCFLSGITKQAQLLRRMPRDFVAELSEEADPGAPTPSFREVIDVVFHRPKNEPCYADDNCEDEAAAAQERRRWVIFQTYFFFYFIFRDLVYSWVNQRSLQGPDYLDRGHLREMNRNGRLLTVLAETDSLIPAPLLREDLASEAPNNTIGGVCWLPTVGHGACQHRNDVMQRTSKFLAAAAA